LSPTRALSAGEAFYLAVDLVCSTNFTVAVRLSGTPGDETLRAALAAIQGRHPLLRVKVVDGHGGPAFQTDGVGPIPLVTADAPGDAWAAVAEHEINECLDPAEGPLIRCAWLRHPNDQSTVLLTFHHAVGDGISAVYLVRDLLASIADSGRPVHSDTLAALPAPLDSRFSPRFRGVRGAGAYLAEIGRAAAAMVRYGPLSAVTPDARAPFRERRARTIPTVFDPMFTEKLAVRARSEQTTVHGALAAAVLLGGCMEIPRKGPSLMALGSPADMRGRVESPIGDVVGMYASVMGTLHCVKRETPFWALAREVTAGIEAGFSRGMQFSFEPMMFRMLWPFARRAGRSGHRAAAFTRLATAAFPSTGFGLTNIGRLPLRERYGDLSVSWAALLPSWSVFAHSGWSASTAAGRLSLTLVYMEPLLTRPHAEALAERTVGLLRSAV